MISIGRRPALEICVRVEGWSRSFGLEMYGLDVEVAALGRVGCGKDGIVNLEAAVNEPPTVIGNSLIHVGVFIVGEGSRKKVRMVELGRGGNGWKYRE